MSNGVVYHILRVVIFAAIWLYVVLLIFDFAGRWSGLFALYSTGMNLIYVALIVIGVDRFDAFSRRLKRRKTKASSEYPKY